eukprot:6256642-Amphidinium_carterae.1
MEWLQVPCQLLFKEGRVATCTSNFWRQLRPSTLLTGHVEEIPNGCLTAIFREHDEHNRGPTACLPGCEP